MNAILEQIYSILPVHDGMSSLVGDFEGFLESQPWIAIFVVLFVTLIARAAMRFLTKKLQVLALKTTTTLDDKIALAFNGPAQTYVVLFGTYLIILLFNLEKSLQQIEYFLLVGIKIAVVINSVVFAGEIVTIILDGLFDRHIAKERSKLDKNAVPIIKQTVQFFLYIVGFLYVVESLGYSITGFLTGLGIGGLAVAMAAKDTLSNFFGAMAIFTDKPYKIGDWIVVGGNEGVVEKIGFRSTRIRTFAKTLITVPNSNISTTAVDNISRMPKRRVSMTIGVTYDTSAKNVEYVVNGIKELLENNPKVDQEYILVNFTSFGASSLDIFIYYFTKTTEWDKFLAAKQEVNLSIMHLLEERNIEFAFPTQTLHITNEEKK